MAIRNDTELGRAVGQLFVGGFEGRTIPSEFSEILRDGSCGGAILFARNFESLESAFGLVSEIARVDAPEPVLVSVDQEGGRVQRLGLPFPQLPPMRVLGETTRKSVAHRAGSILGQSLAAMGFHQNYAPVLDVDSNPKNPVIGDRSFGSTPAVVARLAAAFIDGLQSAGVAACGKHFPGHGDTSADSHLELPRLDHDRRRLEQVELVPFRSAVCVDVAAIMTAHILFSALDPEHPVTLSEHAIEPMLRRNLGFGGVVVSDDLEMKAIADHYGIEDAAVRAIRAGCDQLLVCRHPALIRRAHGAVVAAVERGTLAEERVHEAAKRVRVFKQKWVVGRRPAASFSDAVERFPRGEHGELLGGLDSRETEGADVASRTVFVVGAPPDDRADDLDADA